MILPTFSQSFDVRSYECDLYGHFNNAMYARYIQEAVLASIYATCQASGLEPQQADAVLQNWTAPQMEIEYLLPLFYRDHVEIRISSTRWEQTGTIRQVFELKRMPAGKAAAGETAARGFCDSRFSGLPVSVLQRLCDPEIPFTPAFERFPPPPPPPPGEYRIQRMVGWQHVNASQIVEPAVLLGLVEDAGRCVVAAHGWPFERMIEQGFAILIRRNQLACFQPARLDDELEITTWASGVRRSTATRHYVITRLPDKAPVALVHALGVWVNLQTNLPMRVPAELLEDFRGNIVD